MCGLTPYNRGNSSTEQLDGMQNLTVRHRADARLHQEALMSESLVLKEDLLYDFLGTPNHQCASW
jgi:hypothetical protein